MKYWHWYVKFNTSNDLSVVPYQQLKIFMQKAKSIAVRSPQVNSTRTSRHDNS